MKEIKKKDNESFDGLFHRFQQLCLKDKLFSEIRKREFFIPPSIREKKKRAKKVKKSR
ncbi:MAG TPA: 30S ribosomal protein S21 [Caldisericia bacterium]|nr:30S ribosomal protein S21 [Caldisericia bacterium]HPF49518.1 30S ribosomal protein S21 [Caldisericia bacterium]HPI84188.1 30S ribosomal protein S21 [Caldisericia bacterium]HPQ93517.1 30S ribosomal protein S21 [Caldisericia bacterium]HRV75477.1 30S ribosomal protein S21 [Caldisericia bacterium]